MLLRRVHITATELNCEHVQNGELPVSSAQFSRSDVNTDESGASIPLATSAQSPPTRGSTKGGPGGRRPSLPPHGPQTKFLSSIIGHLQ